ncbi:hypothetical protein M1N56_03790, partial [Dehalococcoidia bacterium]|nr:hypothetical protein [Dehalococcoidia bacterium]
EKGICKRISMSRDLIEAEHGSFEDFRSAFNGILTWGFGRGYKQFREEEIEKIQHSLQTLDGIKQGDVIAADNIFMRRIAATTKIYEMHDLGSWVIYDSNAAHGLARLANQWFRDSGRQSTDLQFPRPPSRALIQPLQGFGPLHSYQMGRGRLYFIYASWLCQAWSELINKRLNSTLLHWKPYHIEMILFQWGKQKSCMFDGNPKTDS